MNRVFDMTLEPKEKIVLLVLADYADADGSCFPGQAKLAHRASIPERTLRRVLQRLEEGGHIERQHRTRGDGTRRTDVYQLSAILTTGVAASGQNEGTNRPTVAAMEPPVEPPEVREAAAPQLSIDDYFAMAWKAWPRSEGKQAAARAFASAVKKRRTLTLKDGAAWIPTVREAAEQLATIVTRYATAYNVTTERGYVPHLSSWLNGERWTDPLPVAKGTTLPSHIVAASAPVAPSAPAIPMTAREPMCPAHPFYPMPCQRCHDEEVERRAGLG